MLYLQACYIYRCVLSTGVLHLQVCRICNCSNYKCVCVWVSPKALPPTTVALSIYCSAVTIFFILIKMVNYRLHVMFDQGEIVAQSSMSDVSKAAEKKSDASDPCLPASIRYGTRNLSIGWLSSDQGTAWS